MTAERADATVRVRHRARTAFAVLVVLIASTVGGLLAVWSFSAQRTLSVGTESLSVSPFHHGAVDG